MINILDKIKSGGKLPWIIGGVALAVIFLAYRMINGKTGSDVITEAVPVATSSGGDSANDSAMPYIDSISAGLQTQIADNYDAIERQLTNQQTAFESSQESFQKALSDQNTATQKALQDQQTSFLSALNSLNDKISTPVTNITEQKAAIVSSSNNVQAGQGSIITALQAVKDSNIPIQTAASVVKDTVSRLGNNGNGYNEEVEAKLQQDLKNAEYVKSEINRTNYVIANRTAAGLDTKNQVAYLNRLNTEGAKK